MQKIDTTKFGHYNLDLLPSLKISDLSLKLTHQITHFWGENGVGKSTVINLIIDELLVRKINFSFVNQNYRQNWLWWYSPAKNLSLAAGLKNEKDIYDLPEVRDQWSWLEKLLIGKSKTVNFAKEDELTSINLSGGQLQRLILFRELLRKPEFLLLDEVFSALDKTVVKELIEWLLEEQKKFGFKIIAISHDLEILEMLPGEVLDFSKDDKANLSIKPRKTGANSINNSHSKNEENHKNRHSEQDRHSAIHLNRGHGHSELVSESVLESKNTNNSKSISNNGTNNQIRHSQQARHSELVSESKKLDSNQVSHFKSQIKNTNIDSTTHTNHNSRHSELVSESKKTQTDKI